MSGSGSGSGGVTVGIDIGTTSVKAVAADGAGTVLARARIPHDVRSPEPGSFEHDPDRAWRADVVAALAQVSAGLDVVGVDVSAMVPSLAAVRVDGTALGPGLLYGDRRGQGEVREGHRDPERAGDSGELMAFLAWQTATHPDAAGFWPAQAVANHALTGVGAIDSSTAMTAMPLFGREGWDAALAAESGTTTAALPVIVPGADAVGPVLVGLPAAGAVVGGGTIDALGEQIVAGADELGDVLVLCGTTLITWGVIEEWNEVEGLWTIPHTARGRIMVGGPSNAGGLFLDWAKRLVGESAAAGLDEVGPGGLPVWLPYVRGERTPLHRPRPAGPPRRGGPGPRPGPRTAGGVRGGRLRRPPPPRPGPGRRPGAAADRGHRRGHAGAALDAGAGRLHRPARRRRRRARGCRPGCRLHGPLHGGPGGEHDRGPPLGPHVPHRRARPVLGRGRRRSATRASAPSPPTRSPRGNKSGYRPPEAMCAEYRTYCLALAFTAHIASGSEEVLEVLELDHHREAVLDVEAVEAQGADVLLDGRARRGRPRRGAWPSRRRPGRPRPRTRPARTPTGRSGPSGAQPSVTSSAMRNTNCSCEWARSTSCSRSLVSSGYSSRPKTSP